MKKRILVLGWVVGSLVAPARTMQLGVLERRATQLRPLFEYSDGRWKPIALDSEWDSRLVPKDCRVYFRGKVLATLEELNASVMSRNRETDSENKNTLTLTTHQPLPKSFLQAEVLSQPLAVGCGKGKPKADWKRVSGFTARERKLLEEAFLKVEPSLHICLQDPKIMMGADPNEKTTDIVLKLGDFTSAGMRSDRGELLAEVTPKYKEMCGKPLVYTGRWFYIGAAGKAVDLYYDLKLEDFGDYNGDSVTDFLFSIFEDGNNGYSVFDGKSLTKATNQYFYQ